MAYAEVAEYKAIYDTDMTDERLSAWLDRAAGWLDVRMGDRLDPEDASQLAALNYVSVGVNSFQQTANGFQESFNYRDSAGGFNLLPSELKMLGLSSSIGFGSWLGGE